MKKNQLRTLVIIVFGVLAGSWALSALEVITWNPSTPKAGDTVSFSINGLDANETVSEWDFGDGNDRSTSDTSVSHSYEEAGTYEVRVTTMIGMTNLEYARSISIAE